MGLYDFTLWGSLLGLMMGIRIVCLQAVGRFGAFQVIFISFNNSSLLTFGKLL